MTRRSAGDMADLWRYDDLCLQLYADDRIPAGTRELALAMAWTALRAPERDGDGMVDMARAARILGGDDQGARLRDLLLRDLPRYERPHAWGGPCDGPRLRPYKPREGSPEHHIEYMQRRTADDTRCGEDARERVDEYDMVTGQISRSWWFCSRHKAQAHRVRQQLAARGEPPVPIPNSGGLLPCYFRRKAMAWWYKWAAPRWEPPYHGICADDWPVPGRDLVPRRPQLALIVGGLEASAPAACSPDAD